MTEEKKVKKVKKKKKTASQIDLEKRLPSLEEMLKAGVHFGHRQSKWNPPHPRWRS